MFFKILCSYFILNFMYNEVYLLDNEIQTQKKQFLQFLKPCNRFDKNFETCVKLNIQKLKPLLREGIPELGIPRCDPFDLIDIVFDQGTQAINITGRGTNMKLYGALNFRFDDFKYDLESLKLQLRLVFPSLRATGNYLVDGEFMQMPVYGAGVATGHFHNVSCFIATEGQIINKNGIDYLAIQQLTSQLDAENVDIDITGLFGDSKKEIATAIITIINKNWRALAEELLPLLQQGFNEQLKNIINTILETYSLQEWLPE